MSDSGLYDLFLFFYMPEHGLQMKRPRDQAAYGLYRRPPRQSAEVTHRRVLDKLNDCQTELEDIAERALFTYAFKLGMRIAIEAFAFGGV
jgi:hypothetical protein